MYRLLWNSLFISCLFFLFSPSMFAQRELFQKADHYFSANLYKEAIIAYEKALAVAPKQPTAIVRLAKSYELTNNLKKAEQYYAEAVKYNSTKQYAFEYAQVLKSNGKIAEAKKWFLNYAKLNPDKGQHFAASCDFVNKQKFSAILYSLIPLEGVNTKNADFAPIIEKNQLIFASSRSVAVEKEGEITWTNDAFNQHYIAEVDFKADTFIALKPLRHYIGKDINDAPMVFTKRLETVAITSNNFMDGIRQIDGSGLMMDIYLYQTKTMKEWDHQTEQFFPFNAGVNTDKPYSTGHPHLSADGSALYFCSNRPGGYGGYDLYVSYKTQNAWTKPKNLGPKINTAGNEMAPFIDLSGRLYFSSDWHHGYGGMDIFCAERMTNGIDWGNAFNLGKPINSPYDDMYFVFDRNLRRGFFSSNRPAGQGNEDIYMVKQLRQFPEQPKSAGKAGDKLTLVDIYAPNQIELTGIKNNDLNSFVQSLKNNKELVVQIYAHTDARGSAKSNLDLAQKRAKAAADYLHQQGIAKNRIRYKAFGEKYLVNSCRDGVTCSDEQHRKNRRLEFIIIGRISPSGQFIQEHMPKLEIQELSNDNSNANPNRTNPGGATKTITKTNNSNYKTPEKKGRKSHYAIGDVIEVANIYYEHNKANVNTSSPGLKELLSILKEQKHVVIEIGSHTDANGSDNYNLQLSQRRANAVKKYLTDRGIPASQLIAKGYGERKILNHCKNGVRCSKAQHAVNRRTEFRVVAQKGFKVGDVIKVDNINYASGSANLDKRDMRGLNEIVKILKENKISVEIRSHTDSRGSASKNLQLSQERAKAVYDYLLQQGVNKYRLKYKGYGETQLLNKCKDGVSCTNAQHAVNRRTDFKVIGLK